MVSLSYIFLNPRSSIYVCWYWKGFPSLIISFSFSPSSTIYLQFFLLSAIASAGLSDLPGGIITQILKLEGFEFLITISFSGLCLLTITTGQGSTKMGHYWLWGQGNSSLCGSHFACCPASPLLAASVIVQAKTSTHISICLLA